MRGSCPCLPLEFQANRTDSSSIQHFGVDANWCELDVDPDRIIHDNWCQVETDDRDSSHCREYHFRWDWEPRIRIHVRSGGYVPWTSIGRFVIGCFLFARLNRIIGAWCRGSLMISFFVQASIVVITAALIQGGVVSSALDDNLSQSSTPSMQSNRAPQPPQGDIRKSLPFMQCLPSRMNSATPSPRLGSVSEAKS